MKKLAGCILMGMAVMYALMLFAAPADAVLIVDGNFDASGSYIPGDPYWNGDPDQASSVSLRTNGDGQDWYESRGFDLHPRKLMLYSNTSGVYGNYTNMARLWGEQSDSGTDGSAYLTQDFDEAQNGTFSLSFDIAIDFIYNRSSGTDSTGFIFVGNNNDGSSNGPNSPNNERFVYLGFYDDGGGTSGQSLELIANNGAVDVLGSTNLWYDTWYTITLDIDVIGKTYDITVDDKYNLHSNEIISASNISAFSNLNGLTSLSFLVGGTGDVFGNGTFFVDNVSEVPIPGGIWLLGSGLIGMVSIRRKIKK